MQAVGVFKAYLVSNFENFRLCQINDKYNEEEEPEPEEPETAVQRVAYITKTQGCWRSCGRKRGPCPGFCGAGQFCCRQRMGSQCPEDMKAVAEPLRSKCIGYKTGMLLLLCSK